jgi:cellulose synthase operon protein C
MRSWAREVALGLALTAAVPPAAVFAAPSAEQILLDKASYWRLKDRPDLALAALKQLLSINPNQPDALYQIGLIEVQQGKLDDARGYLARLRSAAPGNAHIADLENAVRAGQVSPSQLSEARRLAQSGQFSQAVQKYQQSFQGPPPPTFGTEYYQTMAGTQQGWESARQGLTQLVQKSPGDSRAKLALAQVLTYHADTRAQGIRMLEQLTGDPVVGAQAAAAWKQALQWMGTSSAERQLYNDYLTKYPQDAAEIKQHIAEAEKNGGLAVAGPGAIGYADLNRGNLAGAEREFEAELARDANDPAALAGLGILRLRQHRLPQAKELLNHAVTEYRRLVASNPDNQAAQAGLRGALAALHSAETAGAPASSAAAGPAVTPARARADALRAEGRNLEARGDFAGAQSRYQEAIAVDATDPWARLDFARFLARHGSVAQAYQIVDPTASGNSADSFQAAAIFYNEQNRTADALALLERVPPSARTPALAAFRARMLVTAEIARAKRLADAGNTAAARNVLMGVYSQPPQSPEKTQQIADALADIGDPQEALALAGTNPGAGDKKATLNYSDLLFKAGRDDEAVAYLQQAESSGRIGADDRQRLERIKIDIAVKRADDLRTRGEIAGAYDQISPLLSAYPNNPSLLLAAGRIYANAGKNGIAMRFVDAAYQQAPRDLGVIRGAIGGAIIAGDYARARAYLAVGMQAFPNSPRLYYMAAEIARADGNNGAAMYDLQMARRLDGQQAGVVALPPSAGPLPPSAAPAAMPANPFRSSDAEPTRRLIRLAQAAAMVSATDASPSVSFPAPANGTTTDARPAAPIPEPLQQTAVSADSDDLTVPPRLGERPPRRVGSSTTASWPANSATVEAPQVAALPPSAGSDNPSLPDDTPYRPAGSVNASPQLAELPPLPPPPVPGYRAPAYAYATAPGYVTPGYVTPGYAPPTVYAAPPYVTATAAPLQPLPPPPIPGYQPPLFGQPAPVPRDSLELDIERSMAAINAESEPMIQGGFAFRERSGEDGLSALTELGVPIEGIFSPFYTGTVRLQAVPTFLTAGTPAQDALTRFGNIGLLALNPGTTLASLPRPGSQNAGGVSLNAGYAYQMFAGEIGSTPLGFPVNNIVGRLALQWPGPATLTTAYPVIPPVPVGANPRPWQVKVEGVRQAITDSLLSYAGTRDPVTGLVWGGVVKTGGDLLVSYDDGFFGMYAGGGGASIQGQSVESNSEFEGLVGAYVRPYRTQTTAFKVGLNLSYMGYDRDLRYFTFGQGGYFSPQNYVNIGVPLEYTGRQGPLAWLVGGALGVQTFHESSSPYFPTEPGNQAAAEAAFGNLAIYPGRNVTGPAFAFNGQVEYQLDNGFSIGGIAGVNNAQNYTEGVGKIYLRKSLGTTTAPGTATLPTSVAGSL